MGLLSHIKTAQERPSHMSVNVRGRLLDLDVPIAMGILNATPDSFYEASRSNGPEDAVSRAGQMLAEGAAIIDVGACSTRPGSEPVSEDEEMRRLAPTLSQLRKHFPDAILSLDTFRADVAERCIREFGIDIINDISGGDLDARIYDVAARARVPYILTHAQKMEPENYPTSDDLMAALCEWLARRVEDLRQKGVADIILDPGFGFGKTLEQNYWIMNRLEDFHLFKLPILVGISRKSMINRLLDITPAEALDGTTVLNTVSLMAGAHILRVHDVRPAVEAIKIIGKLNIKK